MSTRGVNTSITSKSLNSMAAEIKSDSCSSRSPSFSASSTIVINSSAISESSSSIWTTLLTIHCQPNINHVNGVSSNCTSFTKPTVAIANFSGNCFAKDLGVISPKSNTITVITIVDTVGPFPPSHKVNNNVPTVAVAILTMLLPIKAVTKKRSKFSRIFNTSPAFSSPSLCIFFKRILLATEYAVSIAEKRPEKKTSTIIAKIYCPA